MSLPTPHESAMRLLKTLAITPPGKRHQVIAEHIAQDRHDHVKSVALESTPLLSPHCVTWIEGGPNAKGASGWVKHNENGVG